MVFRRLPVIVNGIRKVDFILSDDNQVLGLEILPAYLNDMTSEQIGYLQTNLLSEYLHTIVDPTLRLTHDF